MIGLLSAIEKLNFGEALLILVLGMLIILAVLSILIGLLYINNAVIRKIEKQPKKQPAKAADNHAAESVEDDEEVIAAVTAAITCIMQEERGETVIAPFKIKKIKHIH